MTRPCRVSPLSAIVLAALLTSPLSAAPPPQRQVPVTSTIADTVGGSRLRVGSDGHGPYVTTTAGKTTRVASNIIANLNGSDWQLTTYYTAKGDFLPSNRTVLFDLSEQASEGSFPTPVSGPAYLPAHLIVKCSQVNIDLLSMPAGLSVECPGTFRFWAPSGSWYRFAFNPDNYPEVDPVKVSCARSDVTGCREWTIAPAGGALSGTDPNLKNRTRLLQIDSAGNVLAVGGEYDLSFLITATR